MTEEQKEEEEIEEEIEIKPLEVTIKKEEEKNPTSYDTIDEYNVLVTDEEIKEMTDAQ